MATKPDKFPRLLVASEFPPNSSGGGPAVARQMLKEWPTENIFWWSCRPDTDQRFGQKVASHAVARIPGKLYPHRRWRRQKSWLLEQFWGPWAARHLKKTLETFQPEVVWAIPHAWSIPPLARVLPHANIGFHVSIHDYADGQETTSLLEKERQRRLMTMQEQLYASATTRDAICQPMVDDLRTRTGRDGNVARAGLEPADMEFLSRKTTARTDFISIAYAGTIIVEKEFGLFVRALARIRQRFPTPVRLDFFSDQSYRSRDWFDTAWMQEHGLLSTLELSAALQKCNWGFSPMALTDDNPRYNRFSFPTKFITYLAAGLPVITLGHPESSLVKIAAAYPVGLCITDDNMENLSAGLLAALSDPAAGLRYRAGIQRCSTEMFDARRMRRVLHDGFQKCAFRTRAPELVVDRSK